MPVSVCDLTLIHFPVTLCFAKLTAGVTKNQKGGKQSLYS